MDQWIKKRKKTAVYYNDQIFTYEDLLAKGLALQPALVSQNNVVICAASNPLLQLLHMVHGLLTNRPVYFGQIEGLAAIEAESIDRDIFLIATTSGTTGRKKWIFKRKDQWQKSYGPHGELFGIGREDVLFVNGSLAYSANLYAVLHLLYTGGTVVLNDDKNPKKWLDQIEDKQCTIGFVVPSKLRLLSRAIGEGWTNAIAWTTAGEALDQAVLRKLYDTCPNMKIHHYYGAAEIGHISGIVHENLKSHPTTVGQAFPGVSIKIKNKIIYAKSPYGALGGQAYESAYDYGEVDEAGYLTIRGRTDTQINSHGRKFDAQTIIETIGQMAEVETCLFVQLSQDNHVYGLYIVAVEEAYDQVSEKVGNYIENTVPRWQWPQSYKIVTKGIYSETGKYDMVRIRGLFS